MNTLLRSMTYAEDLRRRATPAEREMCRLLDAQKISYVFQSNMCEFATGRIFIADFRIKCLMSGRPKGMSRRDWKKNRAPLAKLFVEIDGSSHIGRERYDARRTRWMESHRNAVVLRFTNDDVFARPQIILNTIERYNPAHKTTRPSATSAAHRVCHA